MHGNHDEGESDLGPRQKCTGTSVAQDGTFANLASQKYERSATYRAVFQENDQQFIRR